MKKILALFPKRDKPYFWLKLFAVLGVFGAVSGVVVISAVLLYFSTQVPDYRQLADYRPNLITKVYSNDGDLLAEYAKQRRIYVPISDMPETVIQAFLAAEDADFYNHRGYDLLGIARAAFSTFIKGRKQGASTITQQVAKNFLLTSERTYTRKIKELILARRIETAFSKDEILELYLNQIYLGKGAYGVAAAALAYFNKDLKDLSIVQQAMLAGLPKAPSRYDPTKNPKLARWRRDVVLTRMRKVGYITPKEMEQAISSDLLLDTQPLKNGRDAPHFSEHVRRYISEEYGNETLYKGGLSVFTTLDMQLQKYAEDAVYRGLREYDRRHGYRGALGHMNLLINWQKRIEAETPKWATKKRIGTVAVVLEIFDDENVVSIGLPQYKQGVVPFKTMSWAAKYIDAETKGDKPQKPSDVVSVGDIIIVKPLAEIPGVKLLEDEVGNNTLYSFEQIPEVQGALVALENQTGAIKAMVGGIGGGTGFNRAVQAKRQSGSSFKPFVYSLALDKGYTPASIILDAPVVFRTGEMNEKWKPHNYSEKVYGPSTMRRGLEKSRNLMTIRLARDLGVRNIINYAHKFGFESKMENDLSTALGSASFSLLETTSAYSVFANGGKRSKPYFVDLIQNTAGDVIYRAQDMCESCTGDDANPAFAPELLSVDAPRVISDTTAYQMVSMLQGVVRRGTAWRAKEVGKPVGAKTGTTNNYIDAWLMGFSPTLSIGVWVGFDKPQTMGNHETGSKASGPIWTYFAKDALKDVNANFVIPENVSFVRIDAETGLLPTPLSQKKILEVFVKGKEPKTSKKASTNSYHKSETGGALQYQGIY